MSHKEIIISQTKLLNSLLRQNLPQSAKAAICSEIEATLFKLYAYNGFNYLYWITPDANNKLQDGHEQWIVNCQPDFPEKHKFITGPNYAEFVQQQEQPFIPSLSSFFSLTEGEYSRNYFLDKLTK